MLQGEGEEGNQKTLESCVCLIKAAGQLWKEFFIPYVKFLQGTQTYILK